jgi:hypothetical protein
MDICYRDKEVVGVFVRFHAPLKELLTFSILFPLKDLEGFQSTIHKTNL